MKTKEWGHYGWSFIHYTALGYPTYPTNEDKRNYKLFYYNLQNTLPCAKCARNYKKNISEHPIDPFLISSDELFKWTVDIHNMVNNELNKPSFTYEEARNHYNSEKYDYNYIFKIISILLITGVIITWVYTEGRRCG